MSIDVSIIIPSYNKYPLNLFTLYSLEKQTFASSRFEVLFIDDGSTDNTYKLKKNYHPRYSFRYFGLDQNLGRAKARNIGIREAKGKILIFLDAEIMVHQRFIQHHYEVHQKKEKLVFTGVLGKFRKVYTVLYPGFSEEAFQEFQYLLKSQPVLQRRWKVNSQKNFKEKVRRLKIKKTPIALFKRKELHRGIYRKLSFPYPFLGNLLFKNYGENLDGFHFKWIAFLTGNVSVPKSLIMEAGAFDEGFKGYGFEDWELGYRLYEKGAHFKINSKVPCYHQEHPVVEMDKDLEHRRNFLVFYQKHPSIKLGITALNEMYQMNFIKINQIFSDYEHLDSDHSDQFPNIKKVFKRYIDHIVQQYAEGRESEGLPQISKFADESFKEEFNREIEHLQQLKGFTYFKNLFFLQGNA